MKKRIVTTLLTVCMAATLSAAGCGESGKESNGNSEASQEEGEGQEGIREEPTHIVVSMVIAPGTSLTGLGGMQEAVNAITVPEINVEVEFKTVEIFNTITQYPLWISGNEDLDLICTAFLGIDSFVSQGLLEPMDEYIANDTYIQELLKQEDIDIVSGNIYEGKLYAISPIKTAYGTGYGFHVRKDLLDEAGITIDEKKTYSLDEFGEIIGAIKEKHPDMYPIALTGANVNSGEDLYSYVEEVDSLGSGLGSGALIGYDSTEIINVYDTPEFYDFISKLSQWKEAGYIYPDALTTDLIAIDMVKNGMSAGYFMSTNPLQQIGANKQVEDFNTTTVCIRLTDCYDPSAANNEQWSLPVSCDQPEAAVKFLSLLYQNTDLCSTIRYGIEGVDWKKTENPEMITFPEGVDENSVTWFQGLDFYGDRRVTPVYEDSGTFVSREQYDAYTKECLANPTAGKGYIYEQGDMVTNIMSINTVLEQYIPQLETGVAPGELDTVYQAFLSELKAAGIEEVIRDKQAKLDTYLSEH